MEGTTSNIVCTNQVMKFAYELITKTQMHKATRHTLWKGLENISKDVDEHFKRHSLIHLQFGVKNMIVKMSGECEEKSCSNTVIQDPNKIRANGRKIGKRLKGQFEKRQKSSSSQKSSPSQGKNLIVFFNQFLIRFYLCKPFFLFFGFS